MDGETKPAVESPLGYFSDEQIKRLLEPISADRVLKDGKGFHHVEAFDIRAQLNRIFGFGRWSARIDDLRLVFEDKAVKDGRDKWSVCYSARCSLHVSDQSHSFSCTYAEYATGSATNYPSRDDAHDQAIKTAESQALKRCAVNLGDQFGLSLYNDGSMSAVVETVWGVDGWVGRGGQKKKKGVSAKRLEDIKAKIAALDTRAALDKAHEYIIKLANDGELSSEQNSELEKLWNEKHSNLSAADDGVRV